MKRESNGQPRKRCKARTTAGDPCKLPPIHGGDVCHKHGGSAPQVKRKAQERVALEEVRAWAAKRAAGTDPLMALLAAITEAQVQVVWAHEQEKRDEMGLWLDRLARYSKMALDAGLAERQVRVSEAQGRLIADAVGAILTDLGLSGKELERARRMASTHLRALPGGKT